MPAVGRLWPSDDDDGDDEEEEDEDEDEISHFHSLHFHTPRIRRFVQGGLQQVVLGHS